MTATLTPPPHRTHPRRLPADLPHLPRRARPPGHRGHLGAGVDRRRRPRRGARRPRPAARARRPHGSRGSGPGGRRLRPAGRLAHPRLGAGGRPALRGPLVEPAEARLALSLGRPDPSALAELNRSTAAAPHRAALLVQRVAGLSSDLEPAGTSAAGTSTTGASTTGASSTGAAQPDTDPAGTLALRLTGPGIKDTAQLRVSGLDREFFTVRDRLVADFPAGIDVLFVTAGGRVAGLPRTTAVRAEEIS